MLRLLRSVRIEHRLLGVILIALSFLVLELVVGFLTRSLALVADAFHILSDVIGYVVALLAAKYGAGRRKAADRYTYGYRRAETLGGFFNGCESVTAPEERGDAEADTGCSCLVCLASLSFRPTQPFPCKAEMDERQSWR